MHRLTSLISLFTVFFFVFSLAGNIFIADSDFTSTAIAKDKDKDKDKN